MEENIFDLIVIGGGPAGYVCSIKAAQLGQKVACIEKRNSLGGTCLNEGCIPSKTLLNSSYLYSQAHNSFKKLGIEIKDIKHNLTINLDSMMKNKNDVIKDLSQGINFLFKKNKISLFKGNAKIISVDNTSKEISVSISNSEIIKAKNVVIATGSVAAELPGIPFNESNILSSKGALELQNIPKSLIVVGGGAIGLEMASVWNRLGSKVTVIEYADRIAANMDFDISDYLLKSLEKQGINFCLSAKINEIKEVSESSKSKAGFPKELIAKFTKTNVNTDIEKDGKTENKLQEMSAEKVLVSIGRKPYIGDLLEEGDTQLKLEKNPQGFIKVNENFETNIKNIYAIGDVIAGPMLAHKGEEEGVAVAEILAGKKAHIGWVPSVIYTHPEAASVGKTEQELKKIGLEYKVSKFPFSANSRARANNDTEGLVKVLVDKFDTILGVHIVNSQAATMIAEAVLAMEYGASAEDIARTCHSHPDLNEAFKEAALGAFFKPIHS